MFGITVNSREGFGEAGLILAADVEDARRKYVAAWGTLYDTEVATLYKVGDDLSTTPIYSGYSEAVDTSGSDPGTDEEGEQKPWPIEGSMLAHFYLALAPHAG